MAGVTHILKTAQASLTTRLRGGGGAVLDFLTPPVCPITRDPVNAPGALSFEGWSGLNFVDAPYCAVCGLPFEVSGEVSTDDEQNAFICGGCAARPPAYDTARAAVAYTDVSSRLVVSFKSGDRTELAPMFAQWIARVLPSAICGPGAAGVLIAPTPLHWRRLWARRYNQSALIARSLAATSKLAGAFFVPDLLWRKRATPPQKELSLEGRWRNVAGAFAVSEKRRAMVRGARVLLIDDVVTSGATIAGCARVLKRAGAREVHAAAVARVVKTGTIAL